MHLTSGQAHARRELALGPRDYRLPELLHRRLLGRGEVLRPGNLCCELRYVHSSRRLPPLPRHLASSHVHYPFIKALEGVSKDKYENTYGIKQLQDGVRVSPSFVISSLNS